MNLTLDEFLETLDITFNESNTQYWSKPEEIYEKREDNQARSHFIRLQ